MFLWIHEFIYSTCDCICLIYPVAFLFLMQRVTDMAFFAEDVHRLARY
jgi:hypothetical protein